MTYYFHRYIPDIGLVPDECSSNHTQKNNERRCKFKYFSCCSEDGHSHDNLCLQRVAMKIICGFRHEYLNRVQYFPSIGKYIDEPPSLKKEINLSV